MGKSAVSMPAVAVLQVDLVSAERKLWSGAAEMVIARTVDGEIGILPGHSPLLGELGVGVLRVIEPGGHEVVTAVHGGFLSVSESGVSVLADIAELSDDIDLVRAQEAYNRAAQTLTTDDDEECRQALLRAQARLKAKGVDVRG